ncbi:MAG TPA: alpha/beta fold hydrolase [Pseudolabrys sp.]|nr:alpha/beta fold hydrolase [Pseudolabrys sp.]
MALFVVSHGAWSAGWAWKKMRPLMAARGHTLITPTLTGIGERSHLAHPDIDLDTHIADILGVLKYEDMHGVNLIGHSYSGMVATGAADRARERIAQLIYLDAFVPRDGESAFDVLPEATRAQRRRAPATAPIVGASRPDRCRPTPRRKIWRGARRCACRSRSRLSSRN